MTEPMSEEIAAGLAPLFEEARATGKWFHCQYQDLWFSPDGLEREQANGRLRWGAVNWILRDPQEMLAEAERRLARARDEVERIRQRIAQG